MVDMISSVMLVALGFVPTYIIMEAAWRMGRMTGKRGERPLAGAKAR
jgi:hypothetical protein